MLLQSHKLSRWLRDIIPLILWMALIFALSSRSHLLRINDPAGDKILYKTAHVMTYAILAWFWWRILAPQRQFTWSILLVALILTTLYGTSDEIHQWFVPGRHSEVTDLLFDGGGALLMILLIRWVKQLRAFPETLPFLHPMKAGKISQTF